MTIILILLALAFVLLLALNGYVSFLVAKSDFYEPVQKYCHYALIWFLPVLGLVFCYIFVQPTLGKHSGQYSKGNSLDDDFDVDFLRPNRDYFGDHD